MKNLPPIGQRILKSAAAVALCMIVYYFRTKLPIVVYLVASAFVIPVIYTAVVLDHRNAAFFSCAVFLSIALTHSFDENLYLFVLNRVLDTFIGIILGVAVNDFRFPIRHDNETLYVCGLDDVLISDSRFDIRCGVLIQEHRALLYEGQKPSSAVPCMSASIRSRITAVHSPGSYPLVPSVSKITI